MFNRYTNYTDPSIPEVLGEIRQGVRQPSGTTDIHDHLPRLRKEARGNVLEIGVRFGVSTCALLLGVEEHGGHVYSVDIDDCSPAFYGHPQWTFICEDSKSESLKSILPNEFDLLFVDGDHSYEGCFYDLKNFGPLSKVIMVHDMAIHENPGVVKAVETYFASQNCRQKHMRCYTDSHGLAVLR